MAQNATNFATTDYQNGRSIILHYKYLKPSFITIWKCSSHAVNWVCMQQVL